MSTTQTQKDAILAALKRGAILTAADMQDICGSMNGRNRIGELAREGHEIKRGWLRTKTATVRTYRLVDVFTLEPPQ